MNFEMYYLLMTLPLLNSHLYFDLGSSKLAIQKSANQMNRRQNDFLEVIFNCLMIINPHETDVFACYSDGYCKVGIKDIPCCVRVIEYKGIKTLLTTKCNVSEEVEKNDKEHFNFWNNINIEGVTGNCTENIELSLKHCYLSSRMPKVTWDITLQLAGIFALYFLVFGKI